MKTPRLIIILVFFSFAVITDLYSQKNRPARIGDLDVTLHNNTTIRIDYNILNSDTLRIHEVNVILFSKDDNKAMFPKSLSGDYGLVNGAGEKSINWDIARDFKYMQEDFYPMLILDGRDKIGHKTGGWKNAFVSMAVPGMGDYFVAETYDLKIKPWMRTVAAYSFLGLGYYCQKTRVRDELVQLEYVYGSPCLGCPIVPMFVPKIIPGQVHYRFFKWDSEIFYTIGAAIWIADVMWVFNKGFINDKISKFYWGTDLKIIAGNNGVGISFKF